MLEAAHGPSRGRRAEGSETELLVYAGDEPVGALRLRVVRPVEGGEPLAGLELASKFSFRGFEEPSVVVGEIGGFCVLRRYRGTRAASLLFGALRSESARRGVTHWLAAANTETDSAEEADIVYRLLCSQRLVSSAFHAEARGTKNSPLASRFIYTPDERQRASRGELHSLRLPRVLALFAGKMGARYIGYPAYDRDFKVFATPLAVELAELGGTVRDRTTAA